MNDLVSVILDEDTSSNSSDSSDSDDMEVLLLEIILNSSDKLVVPRLNFQDLSETLTYDVDMNLVMFRFELFGIL